MEEFAALIAARLEPGPLLKALYTVDEAAIYLSCSPEEVRRFMKTRQLPVVKIDSRSRFHIRDLEKFQRAYQG
jgi:excisionase family DNA binding protein